MDPDADAGGWNYDDYDGDEENDGETWRYERGLDILYYKERHQRLLDETASTLQLALPDDIVSNNALPFLELPSDTLYNADSQIALRR